MVDILAGIRDNIHTKLLPHAGRQPAFFITFPGGLKRKNLMSGQDSGRIISNQNRLIELPEHWKLLHSHFNLASAYPPQYPVRRHVFIPVTAVVIALSRSAEFCLSGVHGDRLLTV